MAHFILCGANSGGKKHITQHLSFSPPDMNMKIKEVFFNGGKRCFRKGF